MRKRRSDRSPELQRIEDAREVKRKRHRVECARRIAERVFLGLHQGVEWGIFVKFPFTEEVHECSVCDRTILHGTALLENGDIVEGRDYDLDGNPVHRYIVNEFGVLSYDDGLHGSAICDWCEETICNGNSLRYFDGEQTRTARWVGNFLVGMEHDTWEGWLDEPIVRQVITGTKWYPVDGGLGAHAGPKEIRGPTIGGFEVAGVDEWTLLLEGWHDSIDPSDTSGKINSAERNGLPFVLAVTRTSNVLSTGVSFYVRIQDIEEWNAYFGDVQKNHARGQCIGRA